VKLRTYQLALGGMLLGSGLLSAKVPIMSDKAVFAILKNRLAGQGDYAKRNVRRLGNKTIELEGYVSTEGDFAEVPSILSEIARYPAWAMDNINKSPSGADYHLHVNGLKADAKESLLTFLYTLKLPVFEHTGQLTVRLTPEKNKDVFTLNIEMPVDEKSIIQKSETTIKIYPAEKDLNRLWIYILGQTAFKSWIIYEGLPERLVSRESGERLQIIVANYLKEEDRARELRAKQISVRGTPGDKKEKKGGG
jgi:hypothetical protein